MYCRMTFKALAVWTGILMLAMLNGLLREAILIPNLGAVAGQLLSGIVLSALILFAAWFSVP